MELQFGLDTFGDVTADADGDPISYAQTLRNLVAEGVLADRVGIDFIGIGEHHRREFAASSPEITAAAIAAKTERIHVGTAVTVLSSDDPIRVFQRFSTLDAISGGRAEVILGCGSFTESFPLFGYDLSRYRDAGQCAGLQPGGEGPRGRPVTAERVLDRSPVTRAGSAARCTG